MDAADLLPTLLNSSLWLEADKNSLTAYGMRTLPTSIADATTPINGEKARPDSRLRAWAVQAQPCTRLNLADRHHLALSIRLCAAAADSWQGRAEGLGRALRNALPACYFIP